MNSTLEAMETFESFRENSVHPIRLVEPIHIEVQNSRLRKAMLLEYKFINELLERLQNDIFIRNLFKDPNA